MEKGKYISSLVKIRNEIDILVDELWKIKENQETFKFKIALKEQVVHDIMEGYENG